MRPTDRTPSHEYQLIEYGEARREIERNKPIKTTILTEHEAHTLNYALAMNRTTRRYVKI